MNALTVIEAAAAPIVYETDVVETPFSVIVAVAQTSVMVNVKVSGLAV